MVSRAAGLVHLHPPPGTLRHSMGATASPFPWLLLRAPIRGARALPLCCVVVIRNGGWERGSCFKMQSILGVGANIQPYQSIPQLGCVCGLHILQRAGSTAGHRPVEYEDRAQGINMPAIPRITAMPTRRHAGPGEAAQEKNTAVATRVKVGGWAVLKHQQVAAWFGGYDDRGERIRDANAPLCSLPQRARVALSGV